ncbi:MAG: hypothetical protein JJU13_06855 [Balneolaceae bacterium]|nr:hypothetical protein [Balneolaceae bacterium]
MRLLKFFGVFLATAIVIFGFVLGWNWKSFSVFLDNREALMEGNEWVPYTSSLRGLSEFMGQNPDVSTVASIVITYPDSSLFFEEHTPRAMGATSKFFILAAYAVKMDDGDFTGNEQIEWNEVSRFQLPDVEASAHRESYRTAQNRGWIDGNIITLNQALRLLAEYNDLALADYLWWNLNTEIWDELPKLLDLEQTEMPLPFSGLYLAISPGIQEMSFSEIMEQWADAELSEWRDHVISLSYNYHNDKEKRVQTDRFLNRHRLGNTFMEERDALTLFPKTTAHEMTNLLKRLMNQDVVNEQVSGTIKDWMSWPMETQPGIRQNFSNYGAIYDNRMGLMNGIDFGTSEYTGDTTVQAFFLEQLPVGFWFHASGGHMHQDFMQRLIYDPAMIEQMKRVVER